MIKRSDRIQSAVSYRAFARDVTVAILVSQNNEVAAILER